MQHALIGHNTDLKRLQDEGYELQIKDGYILVHHIPYVNGTGDVRFGTLVSELTLASTTKVGKPSSHTIYFSGEQPCNIDKTEIAGIKHSTSVAVFADVRVRHMFSNKPATGYTDYYHKFSRYADIISAPAKVLVPHATEKTFRVVMDDDNETVFNYIDTNASRAKVNHINAKFRALKVAIIGLGGTGAYILDLLAKTPVMEIHSFDGDDYYQHNAFRSPGAASVKNLERKLKKVAYYHEMYSEMRKGLVEHPYYIGPNNYHELKGMSFVFICIDNSATRKNLLQYLVKHHVSFIDVGMGVEIVGDNLIGSLRVTLSSDGKSDHLGDRVPMSDDENDAYNSNVQIADLNMLNASLAVIRWKKIVGFYQDLEQEYNSTYSINTAQLTNDDIKPTVC